MQFMYAAFLASITGALAAPTSVNARAEAIGDPGILAGLLGGLVGGKIGAASQSGMNATQALSKRQDEEEVIAELEQAAKKSNKTKSVSTRQFVDIAQLISAARGGSAQAQPQTGAAAASSGSDNDLLDNLGINIPAIIGASRGAQAAPAAAPFAA